ncbi:MAG: PEGA domain-containing protein [Chitinivibrionales bacterium]|nr:PEGA domain-containing protein [Chitinivibrionales bacterium]
MKTLHYASLVTRIIMISFGFILEAAGIALIFISFQLGKKFLLTIPLLQLPVDSRYVAVALIVIGLGFQVLSLLFLQASALFFFYFPPKTAKRRLRPESEYAMSSNINLAATLDEKIEPLASLPMEPDTETSFLRPNSMIIARKEKRPSYTISEKKLFRVEIVALIITTIVIGCGFIFLFFSSNPIVSRHIFQTTIDSGKKLFSSLFYGKKIASPGDPVDSTNNYFSIPYKDPNSQSQQIRQTANQGNRDQIFITSYPIGARIYAFNQLLGTTPLTWDKPSIYGTIVLTAEKEEYIPQKVEFEYAGGSITKHILFSAGSDTTVDTAFFAQQDSASAIAPTPDLLSSTQQTATPSSMQDSPSPESSPQATATISQSQETGSDSDSGMIFLSSLPPIADIYLNGKKIGTTNVNYIWMPVGTHLLTFIKNGIAAKKEIIIKPGKNPSQIVFLKK